MKRKSSTLNLTNQRSNLNLGFSLNNPRRVGAHTGQPQTQTPFRGPLPKGYEVGGKALITQSQYVCADAFDIPHVSVKNTRGLISTKYKWMNSGHPHVVVKNLNPGYENYLEKRKGNGVDHEIPEECSICQNSSVKNLNTNYQSYLNRI